MRSRQPQHPLQVLGRTVVCAFVLIAVTCGVLSAFSYAETGKVAVVPQVHADHCEEGERRVNTGPTHTCRSDDGENSTESEDGEGGEEDGWTSSIWNSLLASADRVLATIIGYAGLAVIGVSSLLLLLAGFLLDVTIQYTILEFTSMINSLGGIDVAWALLRDIVNASFIFLLLYIAIKYMLNAEDTQTTKLLRNLILVVLFVNFSLFVTQAIIDGGNIVTVYLYNQATQEGLQVGETVRAGDAGAVGGVAGSVEGFLQMSGISYAFLEPLGITTIFSGEAIEQLGSEGSSTMKVVAFTFFSMIFVLVVAFVFFAISFMLISRFITLIFLMIVSPLAFAAHAHPALSQQASNWWKRLMSEVFFAPALFFFLLVDLKLIDSLSNNTELGQEASDAQLLGLIGSADTDTAELILVYILVIGILVGSLIMARRIGNFGAAKISGVGKMLAAGAAGGAVAGTAGYLAASADEGLKKRGGVFSEQARKITSPLANKQFFGKSGAGLKQQRKDRKERRSTAKSRESLQKQLKQSSNDEEKRAALTAAPASAIKSLGTKQLAQNAHLLNEKIIETIDKAKEEEFSENDKERIKRERYKDISGTPKDISDTVKNRNLSDNELARLPKSTLQQPEFARALSGSQLDALNKDTSLPNDVKKKIKDNFQSQFREVGEALKEVMNEKKPEDLAKIDADTWANNGEELVQHIDTRDLANIQDKINKKQMNALVEALNNNEDKLSERVRRYKNHGAGRDIFGPGR